VIQIPSSGLDLRLGRRGALATLSGALQFSSPVPVGATTDPQLLDIRRYVYVPSAAKANVTVIDCDSGAITAILPTGVIAREAVISRDAATLIVADGNTPSVTLVDVFAGTVRKVALPLIAQRLTVSVNGQVLAVHDLVGNAIALVDIGEARVTAGIVALPPLRDVMFGRNDTVLYVAAKGLGGVGVIDIATARLMGRPRIEANDAVILARTTDGRRVLAISRGKRAIDVLDAASGERIALLDTGPEKTAMFPSGLGNYLMVPDEIGANLAVFRSAHLDSQVVLPGAAGVVGVYAAWLDSVAFMPSVATKSALVYDLDHMRPLAPIALGGAPAPGAVTADTRTLYLPVIDPPRLLAVDGMTRSITRTFDLSSPPLAALIAGGSGICH
jgi:DNA-binding beta-propeller fold protein YncE